MYLIEPVPESDKPNRSEALALLASEHGGLTASMLVDAATPTDSVFHSWFEWDDACAGHKYRLTQARNFIRTAVALYGDSDRDDEVVTIRAYTHLPSQEQYVPIGTVMTTADFITEALAQFKRESEAFARKWSTHKWVAGHYRQWLEGGE